MSAGACAAGWYGKLPALGDFASRRLPQDFITAWDDWLQRGLALSQAQLGDAWLESFLHAPVWRFVLGSRSFVDPQIWAGIVLPSVDRVGRYFPLTLCAALPAFSFSAEALRDLEHWLFALEEAARAGLDPLISLEDFEARLTVCPPPIFPAASPSVLAESLVRGEAFISLESVGRQGFSALLGDVQAQATNALFASHTLWWCNDAEGAAGGFACHGMPSAAVFSNMLQFSPDQG